MTADQTDTVEHLLFDELAAAKLPAAAADIVVATLLGQAELDAALGGTPPTRPGHESKDAAAGEPVGSYLTEIEVTGFRGVGPTTTLPLVPGPGLTIVAGRNGSGKSSFAEAAELALTGDNRRWASRAAVWKEGWRNLHTSGESRIRVRLSMDGKPNGATAECHWSSGSDLADCDTFLQVHGEKRRPISDLGWRGALQLYRPFLSYGELGDLINGRPSDVHDSLYNILGLSRLAEVEAMLKAARRTTTDQAKVPANLLPGLRAALGAHPDARARQAEELLASKRADLDRLGDLTTAEEVADDSAVAHLRQLATISLPKREDVATAASRLGEALSLVEASAGTPAEDALALADLLGKALAHQHAHAGEPCPVCGGRALDDAWAAQARERHAQLKDQANQLTQAHQAVARAHATLRELVAKAPAVLGEDLTAEAVDTAGARDAWRRWDDLLASPRARTVADGALVAYDELAQSVPGVREQARQRLDQRAAAWQPIARQIADWVEAERVARQAATALDAVKKAIAWLGGVGDRIRNQSLEPIANRANEIWQALRQGSSVELDGMRLAGTGTQRRLDISVKVDEMEGAALGVMSQGELHALGLALFLPRATLPASPFRFLIIDDPVQAMDPAKVYGLAQVLAEIAKTRQVIVFTHDDRLPNAVRQLQIPAARIHLVNRSSRSRVAVGPASNGDPADRYLADAVAITKDDKIDLPVRRMVTANLVRDAIESVCHDRIRRREYHAGTPMHEVEQSIGEAQTIRQTLALALLGDSKSVDRLKAALDGVHRDADEVVRTANENAHGKNYGDPATFVQRASAVVKALAR